MARWESPEQVVSIKLSVGRATDVQRPYDGETDTSCAAVAGRAGTGRRVGRPAIFLDRDGVLNENRADYVRGWDEFAFLPGTFSALRRLADLGAPIVVVTNQAGVGRGMIPPDTIDDIHRRMTSEIHRRGGRIERILWCPHTVDEQCHCRKPAPGMLLHAADQLDIDLERSVVVGDAETDIEAGQRAGCRTVLVLTGRGMAAFQSIYRNGRRAGRPDAVADDLSAAVPIVSSMLAPWIVRQPTRQAPVIAADALVASALPALED